ncbi:MAG TPA: integrase arm-type DNA-binding domain-containing protein, partial [Gammaproteobacteria bacterium]|nr:integrase arm-type DNA-binding domain-containing protein [Gammaproteobacteria bacterium]
MPKYGLAYGLKSGEDGAHMRPKHKLTAKQVESSRLKAGYHADGDCLYLRVTRTGTKSWALRWRDRVSGRLREMGLGAYDKRANNLGDARERAATQRRLLVNGIDPLAERRKARDERRQAIAVPVFDDCASEYIAAHSPGWSNPKHVEQWRNTLKTYASPVIGKLPVDEITSDHVLRILRPIWTAKTETASRVRGRVESVLDWAASPTRRYRNGDNPARWRGHLDKELPRATKVRRKRHHPALPFAKLPAFMAKLQGKSGVAAACLRLTILTACRTNETIGARWEEFDLKANVWTVPGVRMKVKRDHRVPLPSSAVALLRRQRGFDDGYVFPGVEEGTHISNMAMLELLRGMNMDVTVHGFRSTFRDWTAETTNTPRE